MKFFVLCVSAQEFLLQLEGVAIEGVLAKTMFFGLFLLSNFFGS
jgi:hypothetical protein